jgi:hypothetical protein
VEHGRLTVPVLLSGSPLDIDLHGGIHYCEVGLPVPAGEAPSKKIVLRMVSSDSGMGAHEQKVRIREGNYGKPSSLVIYILMNFL